MRRNDFVFCIGYQGNTALVDKSLEAKYGRLSTKELFQQGLYKTSFASAIYSGSEEEIEWVRSEYSKIAEVNYSNIDALKRTLGVWEVEKTITRTCYL